MQPVRNSSTTTIKKKGLFITSLCDFACKIKSIYSHKNDFLLASIPPRLSTELMSQGQRLQD